LCFSEGRGARAAAAAAWLGEAVEINVQPMPSFLSASRAVAFLIAYGGGTLRYASRLVSLREREGDVTI
jgi:hypothetical protein